MSLPFRRIAISILFVAALFAQAPGTPTFTSAARLVQVSFNVQRGKFFAADLQPSDFILLEDGHPREFTVFEGPNTEHPLPLELVLLFDTSKAPPPSPHRVARPVLDDFAGNWDESITQTVLQQNGRDLRLSVYHFDDGHFERLCDATRDPREIVNAFRKLLDPIPAGNLLTRLPGNPVDPDDKWRDSSSTGWWPEAAVATLRDVAGSPVAARRVMILFSDMRYNAALRGALGAKPVGDEANASGIEVDNVFMDAFFRMGEKTVLRFNRGVDGVIPVEKPPDRSKNPDDSVVDYPEPFPARQLADMNGGEVFFPPQYLTREALAEILLDVRNTTLSEYVVGFAPEETAKPKKHTLKVELKSKSAMKIVAGEREGVSY